MKHGAKVLGVIAVAGLAAAAFAFPPPGGHGGPGGRMPPPPPPKAPDARMTAMLLVAASDTDRSRDVTADEWSAFLATTNADENGVVSLDALVASLPQPLHAPPGAAVDTTRRDEMLTKQFDKDGDGAVTLSDLDAFFALLDTDGDGALSQEELAPPDGGHGPGPGGDHHPGDAHDGDHHEGGDCRVPDAQKAGHLLARAADADDSHDVTADEWIAFLATLGADENGVISLDALAAALPPPRHAPPESADNTKRDEALTRTFDFDGDGVVETSDLQSLFDALDKNGDGEASKREAKAPKPLRGKPLRAALALARAADADRSRDVSADEWSAFLGGLGADENGAVSLDALADAIHAPRRGDTTRRDKALVKTFDKDGDGVVTTSDLQALFDELDRNADAALDRTELHARR